MALRHSKQFRIFFVIIEICFYFHRCSQKFVLNLRSACEGLFREICSTGCTCFIMMKVEMRYAQEIFQKRKINTYWVNWVKFFEQIWLHKIINKLFRFMINYSVRQARPKLSTDTLDYPFSPWESILKNEAIPEKNTSEDC